MVYYDDETYKAYIRDNDYSGAYNYLKKDVVPTDANQAEMIRRKAYETKDEAITYKARMARAGGNKSYQDAINARKTFDRLYNGTFDFNNEKLDLNNEYEAGLSRFLDLFTGKENTNTSKNLIQRYLGYEHANAITAGSTNQAMSEWKNADNNPNSKRMMSIRFAPKKISRSFLGIDWALSDINFDDDPFTTFLRKSGYTQESLKSMGIDVQTKNGYTTLYLDPHNEAVYKILKDCGDTNKDLGMEGIGIAGVVKKGDGKYSDPYAVTSVNQGSLDMLSGYANTGVAGSSILLNGGMKGYGSLNTEQYYLDTMSSRYNPEHGINNFNAMIDSKLQDLDANPKTNVTVSSAFFNIFTPKQAQLRKLYYNGQLESSIYKDELNRLESDFKSQLNSFFVSPTSQITEIYATEDDTAHQKYSKYITDKDDMFEIYKTIDGLLGTHTDDIDNPNITVQVGFSGELKGTRFIIHEKKNSNGVTIQEYADYFIPNFIPQGGEELFNQPQMRARQDLSVLRAYGSEQDLENGTRLENVGTMGVDETGQMIEGAYLYDKNTKKAKFISLEEAAFELQKEYTLDDAVWGIKTELYDKVNNNLDTSDENLDRIKKLIDDNSNDLAAKLYPDLVKAYELAVSTEDTYTAKKIEDEFNRRQSEIYRYLEDHVLLNMN